MSKTATYIFIIIGVAILGFILWYFKSIVAYILISLVLSLIGSPIVRFLGKLKIGKISLPKAIRALLTLIFLWIAFFTFFRIFVPLVAKEANDFSKINIQSVVENLDEPINKADKFIEKFKLSSDDDVSVRDFFTEKLASVLNITLFSNIFSTLASLLGDIFIAIFAISFMTFFFLKDEKMFTESIILLVPDKHVEAFRHALSSVQKLLRRYFIGIIGQITGIIILVTAGLTIVGVGFKHSLLIGFMAGILNVIPYLGPLLGAILGIILGVATHLDMEFYSELLPLIGYMILVFIIVQTIDNVIFQPFIYSSSVNAHPMEILLIIMIAGSLAGIAGMILAIPSYTVLRVFGKEFFNKFKVVKKLTEKIE
ncbi:MAG: AI-2E family transporter [Bacteroidales bacterium]|nr:MAG: AI-2E family transporter [Bacteroidales bacterium]